MTTIRYQGTNARTSLASWTLTAGSIEVRFTAHTFGASNGLVRLAAFQAALALVNSKASLGVATELQWVRWLAAHAQEIRTAKVFRDVRLDVDACE